MMLVLPIQVKGMKQYLYKQQNYKQKPINKETIETIALFVREQRRAQNAIFIRGGFMADCPPLL